MSFSQTSKPTVCPSCRSSFHPVDTERSTHFGCPECGTFFVDAWDQPKAALRRMGDKVLTPPAIAPGTRGSLDGDEYIVAGIIGKSERNDTSAQWYEYVLYDAAGGTAVLVEFNGHWMLVKAIPEVLIIDRYAQGLNSVHYNGGLYRQSHEYFAEISYASGAFDWNIFEDEQTHASEFILESSMLVQEERDGVISWYLGKYLEPAILAAGFGVEFRSLPGRTGIGVIQPNPYAGNRKRLINIAMVLVLCVGAAQLLISHLNPSSTLVSEEYITEADSAGKLRPIITPPFRLQHKTAVDVNMRAAVTNDWLEVTALLINHKTGRVFESTKSLEQYEGYDDEGRWTEDNSDKRVTFSSVPAGEYHLNIIPAAEGGKTVPLKVNVSHDNWILSNFIIMLLAIVSVPAYNQISYSVFEQKRFL